MAGLSRANALALAGTLIFLGHGAASAPFDMAQGVVSDSRTIQAPSLKNVLERGDVEQFERQLGHRRRGKRRAGRQASAPTSVVLRRQLKSDLLLMQPTQGFRWVQFATCSR
jgi:hypothetical protein